MRNSDGFDLWADCYDSNVESCEEAGEYPFAGYKDVLESIFCRVNTKTSAKVLDIGFGTGVLTARIYNEGHSITGVDFSARMIEAAQVKMPDALLYCHDFSKGLPKALDQDKFDCIISTYAIHHLNDAQKAQFIMELWTHLEKDGEILIGDVAFETRDKLTACRNQNISKWDEDEIYIVYSELAKNLPKLTIEYIPVSPCAGIVRIIKEDV